MAVNTRYVSIPRGVSIPCLGNCAFTKAAHIVNWECGRVPSFAGGAHMGKSKLADQKCGHREMNSAYNGLGITFAGAVSTSAF